MSNLFNLSAEEKNRIRGLHLVESKDNRITSVLSEQPTYNGKPIKRTCIMVNFESGQADILDQLGGPIDSTTWGKIFGLMQHGMKGDRPFIDIKAGTSGTGSHSRNRQVMDERINEAIDLILEEFAEHTSGSNRLQYSVPSVLGKTNIDRNYSTIEPGSILPGGEEVPTDPQHPYFKDTQYVQICINPISKTPGYDSLADQFMEATIRNTFGYDEETVYDILNKLRDAADFEEFSSELERSYDMNFYEIACDKITMDLTPGWMDKILGTSGDVTLATEIGSADTTINVHLKRLGVKPIKC